MAISDLIWELSGGRGPSQMRANMTPSLMAPVPGAVSNRSRPDAFDPDAFRRRFARPGVGMQIARDDAVINQLMQERDRQTAPASPADIAAADANRRQFAVPGVGRQIAEDDATIAQLISEATTPKAAPAGVAPAASSVPAGIAPAQNVEPAISPAILDLLQPRQMDPWAMVPASQRGFAALGFTPVQAMTGNSRDSGRVKAATDFIGGAMRAGQQQEAARLAAAGPVAVANQNAQGMANQATIAHASDVPVANIDAQARRDVADKQAQAARDTAAMDAMAKTYPELFKTLFPGPQATAAGTVLGNVNQSALVANGKGGMEVVPPPPVATTTLGQGMDLSAAPAAQSPAAGPVVQIGGKSYRQVPEGTPGAVRGTSGKFYVPA